MEMDEERFWDAGNFSILNGVMITWVCVCVCVCVYTYIYGWIFYLNLCMCVKSWLEIFKEKTTVPFLTYFLAFVFLSFKVLYVF